MGWRRNRFFVCFAFMYTGLWALISPKIPLQIISDYAKGRDARELEEANKDL